MVAREPDVIVLDKPAGWLVHPVGTDVPDLVTWARAEGLGRLRPAHRLDLDTSGLVVLARTAAAAAAVGVELMEGTVHKRYQALVYDVPDAEGVVELALADARRGRPLPARTRWRCDERLGRFAFLSLWPETGRKHQLRRHLLAIGHPVVGDREYAVRPFRKVPGFPGRLWLHAAELRLASGRGWSAPLPDVLVAHLALLRGGV